MYRSSRGHFRGVSFFKPFSARVVVLLCLSFLLYANLVRLSANAFGLATSFSQAPVLAAAEAKPVQGVNEVTKPTTSAPTQRVQTSAASGANATLTAPKLEVPKACTGSSYTTPGAINLGNASAGLTKQIDTPLYYQVYGDSLSSLRSAIVNCPARQAAGSFHAVTTYQLNWNYGAEIVNGSCQLTNIRVGLHVNQFMPAFSPGSSTPTSVASTWNAYAGALKTHEDGHTALDTEYAEKLIAALQAIGPMDCAILGRQTQTVIDSHVAMLNTANELYDSQTNHGATQGAVL